MAYCWLTFWQEQYNSGAGGLLLRRYNTDEQEFDREYPLSPPGAVTVAQVIARTWAAYAYGVSVNVCYVFGRMPSPGGLSGTHHIIKLDESSSFAFSNVENGWGANVCAAFFASFLSGSDRKLFAIQEKAAAVPTLHWGTNNISTTVTLSDFTSGTEFTHRALTYSQVYDRLAIVGRNKTSGQAYVIQADSPYTTWTDITEDHPFSPSADGKAITFLAGIG